ncbi:hypothetical protein CTAYLR_009379 [Chrysophaeum taylorii]|uniref:Uncharacterized protein n=1 Tax=Chrysophaeum taylorii TaxID=2483200 RepID=A0AAD7XSI5_9STRA|nr:hypothetical protein CTAYLR_009379 [Chrysophaeum taylorii]
MRLVRKGFARLTGRRHYFSSSKKARRVEEETPHLKPPSAQAIAEKGPSAAAAAAAAASVEITNHVKAATSTTATRRRRRSSERDACALPSLACLLATTSAQAALMWRDRVLWAVGLCGLFAAVARLLGADARVVVLSGVIATLCTKISPHLARAYNGLASSTPPRSLVGHRHHARR